MLRGEAHENDTEQAPSVVVKGITLALQSFRDILPNERMETDPSALDNAGNCWSPTLLISETLNFLSSTVLQNKSIYNYANKQGLGFFSLCFMLLCTISMYPKETKISLKPRYLSRVFCKRNMSLKPSVNSCEISPLSDRADCCTSYFLYTCRQKKWQLLATRSFSSVY